MPIALRKKVREGKHLDTRGVNITGRNENAFAQPHGLRETPKLRFSVGDLNLPERRGMRAVGWWGKEAQRAAFVAMQTRVELIWFENVNCTRRNGMC